MSKYSVWLEYWRRRSIVYVQCTYMPYRQRTRHMHAFNIGKILPRNGQSESVVWSYVCLITCKHTELSEWPVQVGNVVHAVKWVIVCDADCGGQQSKWFIFMKIMPDRDKKWRQSLGHREILLNQTNIRLYIPFSDWFGTKETSVRSHINRKTVNTIWFRFDLIRFLCVRIVKSLIAAIFF